MTTPAHATPDEHRTHTALDDAIRAHAADTLDPGELLVNWVVIAGTRHISGGNVITMTYEAMPDWETEGLLRRAITLIDAPESGD